MNKTDMPNKKKKLKKRKKQTLALTCQDYIDKCYPDTTPEQQRWIFHPFMAGALSAMAISARSDEAMIDLMEELYDYTADRLEHQNRKN
jgi:hypothetical protein